MITQQLIDRVVISAVVGHVSSLATTIQAMEYSIRNIPFKKIQILSCQKFTHDRIEYIPIPQMTYPEYNNFIIKSYSNYIKADFMINIQDDGFIINPHAWTDDFLQYDYIGALWPVGIGDGNPNKKLKTPDGDTIDIPKVTSRDRCGNGGFTLRSKKFLEISKQYCPTLDYNEDALVCRIYRHIFLDHGIKYASDDIAAQFAIEFNVPETLINGQNTYNKNTLTTFGFHGKHCDAINFLR